ncbi:universal stress protein [Nonomuraea sp. NPDC004354]
MNGHIVVGVDGSPEALNAVRWAADEAMRRACPLRIVHVTGVYAYDIPPREVVQAFATPEDYGRAVLDDAGALARRRHPDLPIGSVLGEGVIADVLRQAATEATALVVGSRGYGRFSPARLGSVSAGLAGRSPCPVVIVRDPPARERGEIVVGFDDHSAAALRFAFEEAARRGARLRAVHAWQPPTVSPFVLGADPIFEELFAAARHRAVLVLQRWRDRHPQVRVVEEIVPGGAVAAIRRASASADLVVVGSRGRGLFGSALLGSVSRGVLHESRCPVAVVRPTMASVASTA